MIKTARQEISPDVERAVDSRIAAHPSAETIRAIIRGRDVGQGVMPFGPTLYGGKEPSRASELNNFQLIFMAGSIGLLRCLK